MLPENAPAGRPLEERTASLRNDHSHDYSTHGQCPSTSPESWASSVSDAEHFFDLLFNGEVRSMFRIMIWDRESGATQLCDRASVAANIAAGWSADGDVYAGFGLYCRDSMRARGISECVNGITSLRLDVDVYDRVVHPRSNLPKTLDEASEFLGGLPLQPSMVINIGHGLQAYWLFDGPWFLSDRADRAEATEFLRYWGAITHGHAQKRGWEFDPSWDLAGLVRIPGTINRKAYPHKQVTFVSSQEASSVIRYAREDIYEMFTRTPVLTLPTSVPPRAELPAQAVALLRRACEAANSRKFKMIWGGHWKDDYSGRDAADFGLCSMLGFWLGPNPQLIDAAFRASGLYRTKWESLEYVSTGETYGEVVVRKALANTHQFYKPQVEGSL